MRTRAAMIDGLRQLADFLEAHPDITPSLQTYNVYVSNRDEFVKIARLGSWQKVYQGQFFNLRKAFSGGIQLDVFTDRSTICRQVVTGQRVVPAQPATEEHTEDLIEWVCDEAVLLKPTAVQS